MGAGGRWFKSSRPDTLICRRETSLSSAFLVSAPSCRLCLFQPRQPQTTPNKPQDSIRIVAYAMGRRDRCLSLCLLSRVSWVRSALGGVQYRYKREILPRAHPLSRRETPLILSKAVIPLTRKQLQRLTLFAGFGAGYATGYASPACPWEGHHISLTTYMLEPTSSPGIGRFLLT